MLTTILAEVAIIIGLFFVGAAVLGAIQGFFGLGKWRKSTK